LKSTEPRGGKAKAHLETGVILLENSPLFVLAACFSTTRHDEPPSPATAT
jgi:hypothetical protein